MNTSNYTFLNTKDISLMKNKTYYTLAPHIAIKNWGYYVAGAVYKGIPIRISIDFNPTLNNTPMKAASFITPLELQQHFRKI